MSRLVDEKEILVLVDDIKFRRVKAKVDKRSLIFIFFFILNFFSATVVAAPSNTTAGLSPHLR
jgi:hypothetical protein